MPRWPDELTDAEGAVRRQCLNMGSQIIRSGLASGVVLLLLTALPTAAAAAGPGIQVAGYATSGNQVPNNSSQRSDYYYQQVQAYFQRLLAHCQQVPSYDCQQFLNFYQAFQNYYQQSQNYGNNQQGGTHGRGTVTPELPSGVLFAMGLLPLLIGAGLVTRRQRRIVGA